MFTSIPKNDFEKQMENVVRYISENAPISNLLVKYGVYKDVDKSISISEICDRAIMAMKSIQLNYEKNIKEMFSGFRNGRIVCVVNWLWKK